MVKLCVTRASALNRLPLPLHHHGKINVSAQLAGLAKRSVRQISRSIVPCCNWNTTFAVDQIKPAMPRPAHSFGLSDIAAGKLVSAPYICRSCRHLALRQRVTSRQSLRHASSEEIPITEKVRRKIWGTDNPPGLADPYGGESFLEKRRKERALQKEAQELKESKEEHAPPAMLGRSGGTTQAMDSSADSDYLPKEYVRSETWDGLEHLGHKGHWRDMPPKPEDEFHP